MATDRYLIRGRRHLLLAGTAALSWSAFGREATRSTAAGDVDCLVAAWDDGRGRHHVGLLRLGDGRCEVVDRLDVPTRAHGLHTLADGSVLVAARRPGDWLLRWSPSMAGPSRHPRSAAQWSWADAGRRFNGHVLADRAGRYLYTTEIDLDSGQGVVVQRDAATLEEIAVWPTRGLDPHQLAWLPDGRLLVANGGIATQAETGRVKDTRTMDSSLVRLDARSGELGGQWRLADARLSLRHLAVGADGRIGIALQAEHDDPQRRAAAPVFALFDPVTEALTVSATAQSATGYAGDVAALHGGWWVSCPRDDQVLQLTADGRVERAVALKSACALALSKPGRAAWVLGDAAVLSVPAAATTVVPIEVGRFDNHAVGWSGYLNL